MVTINMVLHYDAAPSDLILGTI